MNEDLAITSIVTSINDPQLRQVAKRVELIIKLALEKAVGHFNEPTTFPMPSDHHTLEHLFLARLKQRPQHNQQRAKSRLHKVIHANSRKRSRLYGSLAQVDLHSPKSVAEQVATIPAPVQLTKASLLSARVHGPVFVSHGVPVLVEPEVIVDKNKGRMPKGDLVIHTTKVKIEDIVKVEGPPEVTLPNFKPWSTLRLRIRKTECVDETDGFLGFETGDDEMRLSGYTIDPTGNTKQMGILNLGDSFDDGETKTYSPPKIFASFSLANKGEVIKVNNQTFTLGWPRTYFATLILAEADEGGFPDFLNNAFPLIKLQVEIEVNKAITELIKDVIGDVVGPLVGTALGAAVSGAIGAAVGAIVGWLVGEIINLLIAIWEDDIFTAVTISQQIPFPAPPWGTQVSPQGSVWWKGHGGHYRVYLDWEMLP